MLYLCCASYAQVDVTKYASEDLFAIQPVVSQNYLEEPDGEVKIDEGEESASFFELEVQEGLDLWSSGELVDALYKFQQLKQLYEVPFIGYYLGIIHFERDELDKAVDEFDETLAKEPMFLEAKYMLGMVSLELKDVKEARQIFKSLLDVPAYEAFGHYGMGQYFLQNSQPYQAMGSFKRCIEVDDGFVQAYKPLISLQIWSGKAKTARKTIEAATLVNPEWQEGIMIRGMLALLADGNLAQFEEDVNTLIELDPSNYHYLSIKGFLQTELGNYHEAVRLFRDAVNLEVDSVRTGEFQFSSKFRKEESVQRSLNYYFDHYEMDQQARLLLDRGICLLMSDAKDRALQYFDSALSMEEHPATYLFKGSVLRDFGNKSQSLVEFSKSFELDSTNWVALSYRAEQYMELWDEQAAYSDYTQLIKLRPRLKEGYKNRGIILLKNRHYSNAYRDFSMAVAIDNSDYDLFFDRAIAAMNLSDYGQAETDLKFLLDKKSKDAEAYYLLHECRLKSADSTMAIQYLDSASKYTKFKDSYHTELFELAKDQGRQNLCLKAHDRLVRNNPSEYDHLLNRAKYLLEIGEDRLAAEDLKKYIKRQKYSGEAHYLLANVYKQMGDGKASEKHLKKAKELGFP
ncbi:MAG: tetratricopeptide repeat protein [Bacteroidota bacterium]